MPLVYSVVAFGDCVLCEHAEAVGNFTEVARTILTKLQHDPSYAVDTFSIVKKAGNAGPESAAGRGGAAHLLRPEESSSTAPGPAKRRLSYTMDGYCFHFLLEPNVGLIYTVMADADTSRRIAFAYLENIRETFRERFTLGFVQRSAQLQLSLESQFRPTLRDSLDRFNDPNADQIATVKKQIADIQEIMTENIEKILLRQEKIDLLVEKTDSLQNSSVVFRREARELRRVMWWRNCKVGVGRMCHRRTRPHLPYRSTPQPLHLPRLLSAFTCEQLRPLDHALFPVYTIRRAPHSIMRVFSSSHIRSHI